MAQVLTSHGTTTADEWRKRDVHSVSQVYSRYSDLVVESAKGIYLHTVDGRDVIDFGSGIGVVNLGHGHPAVVAAVHEQVDKLWHTSVTTMHPRLIEAAEKLTSVAPKGLTSAFFCNSGAETVEAAIKLARRATGRTDIIAFTGAFHGRTYGAVSLTASKAKYHAGVGPFLPGVHHVPYPYCVRECNHGADAPCPLAAGEPLMTLFKTLVPAESVAAIIVEPILGEGGYVVPPAPFLPALRRICDEHGILLVVDEVQSGMGRSGKMFAVEYSGVTPDIMCVAKGLGNGMPVGATLATDKVMSKWHEGEHGTTFGGNPVACSAAIAVIDTLVSEGIPEKARVMGEKVLSQLRGWRDEFSSLGDVRGRGLMIGLEFRDASGTPLPDVVSKIREKALAKNLLLLVCGVDDNVIRLVPPLTITDAEMDKALAILHSAISEVGA